MERAIRLQLANSCSIYSVCRLRGRNTYPLGRYHGRRPSKTVLGVPRSRERLWRSCTRRPSEYPPVVVFLFAIIPEPSTAALYKQRYFTIVRPRDTDTHAHICLQMHTYVSCFSNTWPNFRWNEKETSRH